jgi:hypothetical protein
MIGVLVAAAIQFAGLALPAIGTASAELTRHYGFAADTYDPWQPGQSSYVKAMASSLVGKVRVSELSGCEQGML